MIKMNKVCLEEFDDEKKEHLLVIKGLQGESESRFVHSVGDRLLQNKNRKSYPFDTGFVISLESGEGIGYMFISGKRSDEVYLESVLLKKYRGKGYGKLCLDLVTDYLFSNYNIRDVALDISVNNFPSIKTAESCGYMVDEYLEAGKLIYRRYNLNYVDKRKRGK